VWLCTRLQLTAEDRGRLVSSHQNTKKGSQQLLQKDPPTKKSPTCFNHTQRDSPIFIHKVKFFHRSHFQSIRSNVQVHGSAGQEHFTKYAIWKRCSHHRSPASKPLVTISFLQISHQDSSKSNQRRTMQILETNIFCQLRGNHRDGTRI
jgi:hypothetical protein